MKNVWLHYVWATKMRRPVLLEQNRLLLFEHISDNTREKSLYLDRIGGYVDHVHALVSMNQKQTIDWIAQQLKGESAFWYNNRSGIPGPKLQWQDDYFVESVSPAQVDRVRMYIDGQVAHHQKTSFEEEWKELIESLSSLKAL